MIWNERIKERREALGLTLQDVSKRLGLSESTAQRYESDHGIKNIPYGTLVEYSKILLVSPSYLMGWEDAPADGPALTDREAELLRRYRSLDDVGRDRVDMNLNFEYDRCAAEKGEGFRRSEDAC